MYSSQVLDHFQHPRNAGQVANPASSVQVDNPACGDVLKLTLRVVDHRIEEIRFLAQGCVPTMACASLLTELLKGRTITEARQLRREELVKAILQTGTPVIALLFNGSPLSIGYLSEQVPVIFECWYLGQETGFAVADVLFGDYNPGGKLPITIPRSVGHVPAFYNHKPSARRGYLFDDVSPLYPFGFGLSYATFSFSTLRLERKSIRAKGSTRVHVEVTNTGKRQGDEVLQMYIRDCFSSVTRPVKELKGFQRVSLQPGQTRTVSFEITSELLSFYDVNMKHVVEPGEFEIMVGNSSRDGDLQKVILTVTK